MRRSSLLAAMSGLLSVGALSAMEQPRIGASISPRRYNRQRNHTGVGTKAFQRAALKSRRRKEARRG